MEDEGVVQGEADFGNSPTCLPDVDARIIFSPGCRAARSLSGVLKHIDKVTFCSPIYVERGEVEPSLRSHESSPSQE